MSLLPLLSTKYYYCCHCNLFYRSALSSMCRGMRKLENGNWFVLSALSYCHLILWSSCIPKFWIVEIIVACCFIFKKFVAYTGNHMRKVTPTPDPKDKNKEVNVEEKIYCNLLRIKIMKRVGIPKVGQVSHQAFLVHYSQNDHPCAWGQKEVSFPYYFRKGYLG